MGTSSECASFFVQKQEKERMMKSSHVLCIVIVAVAAFWGYSCHSNKQAKKAITYVLEQDSRAGKGVSSVSELVRNQSSISLLNCPSDFTIAYRRYQAAWQDMQSVEEEAKYLQKRYNSNEAFLEALLRGMLLDFSMVGDADEAAKRVRNHHQTAKTAIRDTFHEVLNIAESYGVETSSYR